MENNNLIWRNNLAIKVVLEEEWSSSLPFKK
jgi:hypothetical protein